MENIDSIVKKIRTAESEQDKIEAVAMLMLYLSPNQESLKKIIEFASKYMSDKSMIDNSIRAMLQMGFTQIGDN